MTTTENRDIDLRIFICVLVKLYNKLYGVSACVTSFFSLEENGRYLISLK